MGLSSSTSKTDSKTSQNTNQTETGTTTPITPEWLSGAAQDYVGRIGAFGNMDPNSFVAPSSPLQQMAWQNAGSLGDWRGQAATASQMAQQAGSGGANFAGAPQGAGKFTGHPSELPLPANAFSGAAGPAYQATATGYNAPNLHAPGLVSGQGYSAPQLGQAGGYAAARAGQPIGATAGNAGSASLLDNLSNYQNPYNNQVVNASLADFDHNAAVQQAGLEAQGARTGAFGGSRFGIAQSNLMGEQGRARGALDAGLRSQGFDTAAGLSQSDAANRQQASIFNTGNQTQNSQFNAGQVNQFGLDQAQRQDAASQFGLGQQQQRDLTQAGFANDASKYGADSAMQAALANQGMQGQFGLAQGQLDANAGQFNAQNQTAVSGQNAAANNQMSQFNAQQGDAAQNRQLAAAGMLGQQAQDYGAGTRADLGTMSGLGDQQRAIEQAYAMAGPAQLQLMGQLSGMTPYDILVGRNVTGNTQGTMTGTGQQTTTQSPNLFAMLMQGANSAARAMAGGA